MTAVKRLTLLRHASARPQDATTGDRERGLDSTGEQDARWMGRRLRSAGIRPSLILTSPALRALQTARIVARELAYPLEFLQREPALYLASPADLLQVIACQDDTFNDMLVCGHNPGITQLANQLTAAAIDSIPTCAAGQPSSKRQQRAGRRYAPGACSASFSRTRNGAKQDPQAEHRPLPAKAGRGQSVAQEHSM